MHPTDKRATTDVAEFVTDLEGGYAAQQLSVALSQTAAAVIDFDKKGSVTLKLDIEAITGTRQVRIAHKVSFENPTATGKAGETASGATVMHVAKGGALSLAQPDMYADQTRQTKLPGLPS